MATRAEQIRKRLQQGEEAKERVLSGMYNQPKTPVATVSPRTQAIRSYVPPDPAGTPMKDLMNQFPSINPMESSLMRGVSGDKAAQKTWEQNSGIKFKPIQGPPAPPQPSEYEKVLQDIESKRPDGFWGNVYDYTVAPWTKINNTIWYGNDAGNFVTRAVGTGAETVLGSPSARPGTTGNARADKIADIAGTIGGVAGLAFNPAAAGVKGQGLVTGPLEAARAALNTGAGQGAQRLLATGINKAAPRMSAGTADRLARTGIEGSIAGGIGNVGAGLVQGQDSNQEIVRNALLGVGLGGIGDMAISSAGAGLRRLEQRRPEPVVNTSVAPEIKNPSRVAQEASEEPFELPPDGWFKRKEAEAVPNLPIEKEADDILRSVQDERMRDRLYRVLDNAEIEARERIQKRRGQLNSNPIPEWTDYTIIGAAKLGKGTIKFADWTEEMVKDFGENFRPQAERVYQAAKEELRRAERMASKEGQEAVVFNSQDIGDVDTFAQKISQKPTKKKQSFSQRTEKLRTQMIDDLAPLEGLEKRVRGTVASAEDSLYKSARLFRGMPAKANQVVKERLGPVVDAVEKSGFSTDELGYYTLARHAKDVNAAGYKSGFTNREIEAVLQRYNTPEMEKARQELVKVNNDMLNELADAGVISRELYDTLTERWKNYVPLFRAMEDEGVEFGGGLSKALANVASPIKALKGSEKKVIDPLENMVKNIFQSTSSAERNRVAQQLAKLAKDDTDAAFIRKLGPDEAVGRKNVVNVKVNGENVKYEVEPEVYKALLNLDQESGNMLIRILQKPASLLRAGATLTPEFSLRNPMRDIMQAFVVSKSGFNPLIDFPIGIIESIAGRDTNSKLLNVLKKPLGKGELYKQWVKDMGDFGNIISMDRDAHKEALQRVLKEKPSRKFVNVLTGKSLLNLLRVITDTTESATKVGEYRAALRKGESRQEAAYRSRDIMDFGRSGVSIRQTNKVIAFLNANIQGKSKLLRAIKEDPIGVTTRAAVGVTLPTVGVFFLQKYYSNDVQKKTIEESPDWLKNSFWLVPVPGTDQVARIPKPFDLAAIFANAPERALQYAYDKDKEAFDGFAKQSLSEAAIPVQITGLLPFIEGMANYSFFRQGSIIPMGEQSREFRDQYDPVNTTETAKLLARGAESLTGGKGAFGNFSSPRIMDNTLKGLTAGLGTYATSAIDSLLEGKVLGKQVYKPVIDKPEKPEKRIEQRPLAKAFLVDPLQGGKSTEIFYEVREKLTKQKNSANFNETKFDSEKKRTLKRLDKISSSMSNITKEIRAVERDTSLTPAQKRNQIEPLIQERNDLARNAVQEYDLKKYKK